MNKLKFLVAFVLISFCFVACNLNENDQYDLKFIHIMQDEASTATVSATAKVVGTYTVYLSSARFAEPVEVTYKISVGAGLKEGVDYKLITQGDKLVFLPGIFDMPIRIQWLPSPIDVTKDNTLTITLVSNNQDYTIGLPGPDHNQSVFTITKVL
jgi:hypothetical protein